MLRNAHPADYLLLLAGERQLTPRQLARVDSHLSQCESCRSRRARLETALSEMPCGIDMSPVGSPVEFATARRRLQNALRAEANTPSPLWQRSGNRLRSAIAIPLAIAAGLLLAAVLTRTITVDLPTRTLDHRGIALPFSALTPGAVSTLTADALCAGARPSRVVSRDVREQVLSDYGMRMAAADTYELDALVTPELGGTVAPANLWPQRYNAAWNAHVKDALENLLAGRVCRGETPLAVAQRALADDWIAAYKMYFRTDEPITAHLASVEWDDDLIMEGLSPRAYTRAMARATLFATLVTRVEDESPAVASMN